MSLIEAVIAAVLVSLSAGSSLQIWSLVSEAVNREERRQRLAGRLESELAALEASLRQHGRQLLATPPCGNAAASLHALLASRPSADGVQRQLRVLTGEDALLLDLAIEGLPIRRQRLYAPAALGLCTAVTPGSVAPGSAAPLPGSPPQPVTTLPGTPAAATASPAGDG